MTPATNMSARDRCDCGIYGCQGCFLCADHLCVRAREGAGWAGSGKCMCVMVLGCLDTKITMRTVAKHRLQLARRS